MSPDTELNMRFTRLFTPALIATLLAAPVFAADQYDELRKRIGGAFNGAAVTKIEKTPIPSLVEVEIDGVERLYSSLDGRYIFSGDMFETIAVGGVVNLSEQKLEGVRGAGIKALDKADMITFAAKEQKAEVFIFTDTSCGYCQRMHQQMSGYNDLGITIHYLAFPRSGMGTPVADTMRAIWCESDPQGAMTEAKLNGVMARPNAGCKDPVASQYELGSRFGVRGTPAIFTSSGKQLGGYISPADMGKALGLK